MNTKGMKFLAVLAVLAMAFAAFAVIAPAEQSDATATYEDGVLTIDGETVHTYASGMTLTAGHYYYVASSVSNVQLPADAGTEAPVVFLLPSGVKVAFKTPDSTKSGDADVGALAVQSISGSQITFTSDVASQIKAHASFFSTTADGSEPAAFTSVTKSDWWGNYAIDNGTGKAPTSTFSGGIKFIAANDGTTSVAAQLSNSTGTIAFDAYEGELDFYGSSYNLTQNTEDINLIGPGAVALTAKAYSGKVSSTLVRGESAVVSITVENFTGTINKSANTGYLTFATSTGITFTVTESVALVITEDASGNVSFSGTSATLSTLTVPSGYTFSTSSLTTGVTVMNAVNKGTVTLGAATIGAAATDSVVIFENTGILNLNGTTTIYGQVTNGSTLNITGAVTVAEGAILNNTNDINLDAGSLTIADNTSGEIGKAGLMGKGGVIVGSGATLSIGASATDGEQLNDNTLTLMQGATFTQFANVMTMSGNTTDYVQATMNALVEGETRAGWTYTVHNNISILAGFLKENDIVNVVSGYTVTLPSGEITIPEGVVIVNNGNMTVAGASLTIALDAYLVNQGSIDVKSGSLTVAGSDKASGTSKIRAGFQGITGDGLITVFSNATLTIGVDNTDNKLQLNTNSVKVFNGGKFTAMIGTEGAPLAFSSSGATAQYILATMNSGSYEYEAVYDDVGKTVKAYVFVSSPGFTYSIAAAVTVDSAAAFLREGDVVDINSGYTTTVTELIVPEDVVVNNAGDMAITNLSNAGTINNSGTIKSATTFTNTGSFINTGTVTALTTFTNAGVVSNAGTITDFGAVTNSGVIYNTKTISDLGTYTDSASATFSNSGEITLGENLAIAGEFDSTEGSIVASQYNITVAKGAALSGAVTFTKAGAMLTLVGGDDGAEFVGTITMGTSDGTTASEDYAKADLVVKAGMSTLSVTAGSLTLAGFMDADFAGSKIIADGDVIIATMTITDGTVTLDGDLVVSGTLTLSDTTVTVLEDATIDVEGSIIVDSDSVFAVDGIVNGDGVISNNGVVKVSSTASLIVEVEGKAVVDEDNMDDITVNGNSSTGTTYFPSNQNVTVQGSWTLISGADVTVSGKLIVPIGTTLTIEADATLTLADSAKLIVYGELIIEEMSGEAAAPGILYITSGAFSVYGKVSDNGVIILGASQTVEVFEEGSFTIEESGTIVTGSSSDFQIDEGAKMIIYGVFDGATIYNGGEITIESDSPATLSSYIYQRYENATVYVKQYTILSSSDAQLVITDDGYRLYTYREDGVTKYVTQTNTEEVIIDLGLMSSSSIISSDDYSVSFGNITVISTQTSTSHEADDSPAQGQYNNRLYKKNMYISGQAQASQEYIAASGTGNSSYIAVAEIDVSGTRLFISEDLEIMDNIKFSNYGTLEVSGEVETQSSDAVFGNYGTTSVIKDGVIRSFGSDISSVAGSVMNATKIIVPTTDSTGKSVKVYTYLHINAALDIINNDTTLNQAEVFGKQTMTDSSVLTAGNTLIVSGTLNVGSASSTSIEFNVQKNSTLRGSGAVEVYGQVYAEDKRNVNSALSMNSDVYSCQVDESGKAVKDGWAKWNSIVVALAESGAKQVTLQRDTSVSSSITVPAGVTLIVPAAYDLKLADGVTLTIDGVLQLNGDILAQTGFDLVAQNRTGFYASCIVVNGSLMSTAKVPYANSTTDDTSGSYTSDLDKTGAPIAGAYYSLKRYNVISNIDTAMEIVSTIQSDITVFGSVTASNLEFVATENCERLIVNGDYFTTNQDVVGTPVKIPTELRVSSIALDGAQLVIDKLSAAGDDSYGSFTGTVIVGDNSVSLSGVSSTTTDGFKIYDKSDSLYMTGDVVLADKGDALVILTGKAYSDYIKVDQVDDDDFSTYVTVMPGAELIAQGTTPTQIELILVTGTLTVPAGKFLTLTDAVILGDLNVAAATGTTAKGTLTVNGEIFIGLTEDDLTAASATVTGPVNFGNAATAYVEATASVDDTFQAKLDEMPAKTEFYVELELWFTAYANNLAEGTIVVSDTPVENSYLVEWDDINGNRVDTVGTVLIPAHQITIGDIDEVYAVLKYDLYTVQILADQGVENITIDGIILESAAGSGGNTFVTPVAILAGVHTVKYELKNGYSGTATMTLQGTDGCEATVSGLSFSVSGDEPQSYVYLQLKGISGGHSEDSNKDLIDAIKENTDAVKENKPSNNEWTMSTILMLVLVVVIAFMAVVLFLRLNRQ